MKSFVPFNLIDDNAKNIDILRKIIEKIFPNVFINCFNDGLDGWNFIKTLNHNQIIICGMEIPSINGLQVLKNIRLNPDTKNAYFIIISNSKDTEYNFKLLQQGADDFFSLPLTVDDIFGRLRAAFKIVNTNYAVLSVYQQLEDIKKESGEDSIRVKELLYKIVKSRMPWIGETIVRITEAAIWIAKEYGVTDEYELSVLVDSCRLAYIGKLFLSDVSIKSTVTLNGLARTEIFARVPVFAKELLDGFKLLQPVMNIVSHIYENFDGSGIPEKFQAWQIPLGSRILRTLIEFEELSEAKRLDSAKIIDILSHESKRVYDYKILTLLDQFYATKAKRGKVLLERPVQPEELMTGMTLSRNIITETGMKLIAAGTILDAEKIEKILTISQGDNIIGKIYIIN